MIFDLSHPPSYLALKTCAVTNSLKWAADISPYIGLFYNRIFGLFSSECCIRVTGGVLMAPVGIITRCEVFTTSSQYSCPQRGV